MEKCPTPGQRFSDKFPTTWTDKVTNDRQMQGVGGGMVIDWAIMSHPLPSPHPLVSL